MMSKEKAQIFQKYPHLILSLIKERVNNENINVKTIYFARTDKNLQMNMVILFVEYDVISP